MTVNYIQNFSSMRHWQCLSTNKLIQARKHSVGAWGEFLGGLKGLYKTTEFQQKHTPWRVERMKPGLLWNYVFEPILPSSPAVNPHFLKSPSVMSTSFQSSLLHYHFFFHNTSSSLLSSQHLPPSLVLLCVSQFLFLFSIWSTFLVYLLQEWRILCKLLEINNLAFWGISDSPNRLWFYLYKF